MKVNFQLKLDELLLAAERKKWRVISLPGEERGASASYFLFYWGLIGGLVVMWLGLVGLGFSSNWFWFLLAGLVGYFAWRAGIMGWFFPKLGLRRQFKRGIREMEVEVDERGFCSDTGFVRSELEWGAVRVWEYESIFAIGVTEMSYLLPKRVMKVEEEEEFRRWAAKAGGYRGEKAA